MAAAKKKKAGKTARPDFRWIALIFLTTVLISALMSFVSSNLLEGAGLALSFLILICIVLTGILFDIIGVAVTAATRFRSTQWPRARCPRRRMRCA